MATPALGTKCIIETGDNRHPVYLATEEACEKVAGKETFHKVGAKGFDCPFDALKVISRTNAEVMDQFEQHCRSWGVERGYEVKSDTDWVWVKAELDKPKV